MKADADKELEQAIPIMEEAKEAAPYVILPVVGVFILN